MTKRVLILPGDGIGPDIEDMVFFAAYMFQPPSPPPPCMLEADVNGNGVGPDIEDMVYLSTWMFSPPSPPPVPCD